jgi:prepilin-type N-terminal cleavage/methylation domain-containing protein
MCASKLYSEVPDERGFSLVELMVAVAFMGILMGGMARIFASSTSSFLAGMETLTVQRNARWGLAQLQNDFLQAGFQFPQTPTPAWLLPGATSQPPLLMQATAYTPDGGTGPVDEFQMVVDLPTAIQGTAINAITKGDTQFDALIPSGADGIQNGDLVFIKDGAAEFPIVTNVATSGSTTTISLPADETAALDPNTGAPINSMIAGGGFQRGHLAGMPFMIIHPSQVVRYTVVPRALDPQDATRTVPCLVRQTKVVDPSQIWAPAVNVAPAGEQILLENVVGFAVDWSIDGGQTWLRADKGAGNSWTTIYPKLQSLIKANLSPFVQKAQNVTMWTVYTPLLIRLDLTTRSVVQRAEFNPAYNAASPQAAYRTRKETILLAPRNCGLGQ